MSFRFRPPTVSPPAAAAWVFESAFGGSTAGAGARRTSAAEALRWAGSLGLTERCADRLGETRLRAELVRLNKIRSRYREEEQAHVRGFGGLPRRRVFLPCVAKTDQRREVLDMLAHVERDALAHERRPHLTEREHRASDAGVVLLVGEHTALAEPLDETLRALVVVEHDCACVDELLSPLFGRGHVDEEQALVSFKLVALLRSELNELDAHVGSNAGDRVDADHCAREPVATVVVSHDLRDASQD